MSSTVHRNGVKCVVIHGNDTDIVIILVYYATTLMTRIELWVRKSPDSWYLYMNWQQYLVRMTASFSVC